MFRTLLGWLGLAACCACKSFDAPAPNTELLARCCQGAGACIPTGLLSPALSSHLSRDACAQDLSCVPDRFVQNPAAVPANCRSFGAEGRCLAACLPEVATRAEQLDADRCDAGELCVPCFDPRSGEDLGVCQLGADPGPREPAFVFPECCEHTGRCVPRALLGEKLSEADAARLPHDSCESERALCLPSHWLDDPQPSAAKCQILGAEGRCLPACWPEVAARAQSLAEASCASAELCVPCFDPVTGEDSGACRLAGDEPHAAPFAFADCCSGAGRCVPRVALPDSISSEELERLARDTCEARDDLCLPGAWLQTAQPQPQPPAACRVAGDFEGRCLPHCLPEVAARAGELQRESCEASELCVPCFDPRTGDDTQACRLAGDTPHEPAPLLAGCCHLEGQDFGRCVPRALVSQTLSEQDSERLGAGSCERDDAWCLPTAWLTTDHVQLQHCAAPGDLEGRCLPACLPEVVARSATLRRSSCDASELCVPCYDPISGADTRACRIGTDEPQAAARSFERCCAQGRCVPTSLLSEEQRTSLPVDTCSEYDARCVPEAPLRSPPAALTSCTNTGDSLVEAGPGLCLEQCFITSRFARWLPRATCSESDRCVPCSQLGSLPDGGCH